MALFHQFPLFMLQSDLSTDSFTIACKRLQASLSWTVYVQISSLLDTPQPFLLVFTTKCHGRAALPCCPNFHIFHSLFKLKCGFQLQCSIETALSEVTTDHLRATYNDLFSATFGLSLLQHEELSVVHLFFKKPPLPWPLNTQPSLVFAHSTVTALSLRFVWHRGLKVSKIHHGGSMGSQVQITIPNTEVLKSKREER